MRLLGCVIAVLCLLMASRSAPAQQQTAIPVGVLAAERRAVTRATEFVGRVEAIARVEIRARVTGFLEGVLFKEGDVVNEGDPLYIIERDTFQASVQQARGAGQEGARSKFANATLQRRRTQELASRRTPLRRRCWMNEASPTRRGAKVRH